MSTLTTQALADFTAIAEKFNNKKVWQINEVKPLFIKYPEASMSEVITLFKKREGKVVVAGAYLCAKSGTDPKKVSLSKLNRVIDAEGTRLYTKVAAKTTEEAQLKAIDDAAKANPAVEPNKSKSLVAALKVIESLGSIDSDSLSVEGAAALLTLRSIASKTSSKVKVSA